MTRSREAVTQPLSAPKHRVNQNRANEKAKPRASLLAASGKPGWKSFAADQSL
jgi:hypothetical protein